MDPTKKALTLLDEFKSFAFKGNVVDLAVAVIIGGAFGKVVDSLVKNLLMPLISTILPGEQGYIGWQVTLNGVVIPFGLVLGEVVNFLIVALAVFFFVVKFLGLLLRFHKEEKPETLPSLTKDQELLMEIRDLLRSGGDRVKG